MEPADQQEFDKLQEQIEELRFELDATEKLLEQAQDRLRENAEAFKGIEATAREAAAGA